MADKVEKPKKKAKPKKDDKGVLAALSSTRPDRIGTRRPAASPSATKATATTKTTATRKPPTAAKKTSPSPRATATGPKAAAPRTFEPTPAAEASAGERTDPRPRPVSEGAPGIGTAGPRDEPSSESARPSGAELATTAVKAVGEVAQLGITVGGHMVKRIVDRLPKL